MASPDIKLLIGAKGGASPSGASAVEIRQALQAALSGKNGVKVNVRFTLNDANNLRQEIQKSLNAQNKELGMEGGNIFTYIQDKVKSDMAPLVMSKLKNALIKGAQDGVAAVKELNAEMTRLRSVTGASQAQMDKFMDSAIAKSKNVGSSVTDMLNSTTVYAHLGYSMDESADLAEYTAMLQNVGDIDVGSAQNAITAIIKAYDVGVNQIETTMDKMVTVGNNFPISVSQLADGMNNAGSALSAAGNSFDQSLALLAASNTTVQDISKSSTGLRTIAARIRNAKTELDELGESMTNAEYDNLVQSLTKANVSLTGANGELRSTYDILQDVAKAAGTMSKNDLAALAETLAGARQQDVFHSLINQFNEASRAMGAMTGSDGAMSSANSVYMESVGAKADRMKASFQELSYTLLDSSILGWLYDFGNAALNAASALDAWPAKIALVAAGLPTLIGLFNNLKNMPLIQSIGTSFKDLAHLPMMLSSFGTTLSTISGTTNITKSTLMGLTGEFKNLSVQQIAQIALSGKMSKADLFSALQKAGLTKQEIALVKARLAEAGATGTSTAVTVADTGAKAANTAATFSLTAALKGLWATTKTFIIENPFLVVLAIITAATAAIIYAAGAQERAIKKQREHTEELKQEYNTLLGEVQSLTNEFNTVKSRMDELQGKGSLSFVEQEELSRLEKQNELLAKQIELRKQDAAEKAKETNESVAKEFELEYNTTSPKYQSIKAENQVTHTVYAQGEQEEITTGKAITQLELYDELIERAKELDALRKSMSADEWLASGNQSELDWVNGEIDQISDGFGTLARKVEDAEGSGTEAFETYYDLFKLGQDAQNGIFWSTAANADFKKVWDDSNFKSARDKLQSLADTGGVTVDILNGDEFRGFLAALGPDLTDTGEKMDSLAAHINSLGASGGDSAAGADSLKDALSGLSDETAVLRNALAKLGEGSAIFDKWIGSDDNLKSLLDKFPNLRDELEAYNSALIAGEDPQEEFVRLQQATSAALHDFNVDEVSNGVNDVVEAVEKYGASSNRALQEIQNLDQHIPGLVNSLYDESGVLDTSKIAALQSADALFDYCAQVIQAENTSKKADLDNLVSELAKVSSMAYVADKALENFNKTGSLPRIDAIENHKDNIDSYVAGQKVALDMEYKKQMELLNAARNNYHPVKEVYVPDVDPLYRYLQTVEDINDELDGFDIDEKLLDEDDFEGKTALIEARIDKLEDLKTALHELNNARDVEIATAVDKLNDYGGFQATYNKESGQALINNMDALKGLTGDTAKAAEELISFIENGSKAALSTSKEYMEALVEQNDLLKEQRELQKSTIDDHIDRLKNQIALDANHQEEFEGNLDYQGAVRSLKDQKNRWEEVKRIAHEEANKIRAMDGFDPAKDEWREKIQHWRDIWWEADNAINEANNKIVEDSLSRLDSFIQQADNFNWWDNIETTKVDMLEKKLETIHQLYANGIIPDAATYKKLVDETAKEIYDEKINAIEQVIDYTKKLIEEEVRLRKEELEEQVDDYKKIVDLKKESLRASKDEADYQKSVAEKTKAITQLQQQINTLALSDDRRDIAERKKLEEELADLQGELADAQADHTLEAQEKALDDSYTAFEKEKNDEVKMLEAAIDTEGKLYALAIERIDQDWNALYTDLMQMNSLYWDGIAGEAGIKGAWDTAKQAAEGYKGTLETIQGIEKERAALSGSGTSVGSTVVSDTNAAYLTGDIDTQKELQAIGAQMQTNSQMWHTAYNAKNQGQMNALHEANQDLADRVEELTGQRPVFDSKSGYWKLGNGERFYKVYHKGGIVGSDEEFAKLQKGELVVPKEHVTPTMKMLEWGNSLASKMRGLFSSSELASSSTSDAIKGAPLSPAAGAIVNNNAPSFAPNIQVEVKYDGSASPADAKRFGENITAGITEAFRRKGVGTGAKPLGVTI